MLFGKNILVVIFVKIQIKFLFWHYKWNPILSQFQKTFNNIIYKLLTEVFKIQKDIT